MELRPGATTRVVFYTESTARGGAEVSLRNLLAALTPAIEATVLAVAPDIGAWIAEERPGTPVVAARTVRGKLSFGSLMALRRQIDRLDADVFHANLRTIGDAQYGLLAASTIRDLAVVAVEQLPYPAFSRLSVRLKRVTSRRLAAHVAVGDAAARQVERLAGLPPASIETIYNGVPDRGAVTSRAGRDCVVGTLARLDSIKGIDVLLRAAAELPDVRLRIVGEGPERESLLALAHELGIDERVAFLPWTNDVNAELAAIDIFVLPSRNEGFPLSIVEAMLAGRPVIATAVGSVAEAVDTGTGAVVPPDDPAALRDAIAVLAADPQLRLALGRAGRQRAVDRFTAAVMAHRFEELYARITDDRASGARRRADRLSEAASAG